jgi:tetratricopeptide (TPR) repeat protein
MDTEAVSDEVADLLATARQSCSLERCEEAIASWEQASSLRPDDPDVHYQLGFCCAGGCRTHTLVDPEIAIHHFQRALSELREEDSLGRAQILSALGNTHGAIPNRTAAHLLAAIDCQQRAASIFWDARAVEEWAREEYNAGNTWCELTEREYPGKWQKAIEHYERALLVRTRDKDPAKHAAALQNLGTAYRELKTADRRQNIRAAIGCFHRALRAVGRDATAEKRANFHNNLGNAYLSLAAEKDNPIRNARRALLHFANAAVLQPTEKWPCEHARIQFNRSGAFLELAVSGVSVKESLLAAQPCLLEARLGFAQCGQTELVQEANRRLRFIANALQQL